MTKRFELTVEVEFDAKDDFDVESLAQTIEAEVQDFVGSVKGVSNVDVCDCDCDDMDEADA